MRNKVLPFWAAAAALAAAPSAATACEPIIPLTQLLSGASLAGPVYITQSLFCLVVAVAIKCAAFVFLERRLSWRKAVTLMLLANVLSTIPGLLIAAFAGSVAAWYFATPIVFVIGALVHRRLKLLAKPGQEPRISGGAATSAFVGLFMLSMVLYQLADSALSNGNYGAYWATKFVFVTLVACTGIIISAVLEECAIARFTRESHAHQSFYPSVFRANYITLGCVLLVAAIQILPKRLSSPHFITSWLHILHSTLGLT